MYTSFHLTLYSLSDHAIHQANMMMLCSYNLHREPFWFVSVLQQASEQGPATELGLYAAHVCTE